MFPEWGGKELKPSGAAFRELLKHNMDLYDVLDILENGYDCQRSKREKGTIEKCMKKGKKIRKVVVVDSLQYYDDTEVWLITHIGVIQ